MPQPLLSRKKLLLVVLLLVIVLATATLILFFINQKPKVIDNTQPPPRFLEQPKNFTMPKNAEYVPSQINITYKPESAIITAKVNQHQDKFTPDDITGLSSQSIQILKKIGVVSLERVFKDNAFVGEANPSKQPNDLSNYFTLYLDNDNIESAINKLLKDPNIIYAVPNYIYRIQATNPDDSRYPQQWGLKKIHADEAWDLGTGSRSVKVATVDSGVDLNHPDLNLNVESGGNFAIGEQGRPAQDDVGHGTHVAGIIGAVGNNGTGVTGVNWTTDISAFRVAKRDPSGQPAGAPASVIARGIVAAADSGAKVMNISMGTISPDISMYNATQYAIQKNIVVVAATGNEGIGQIGYPAAFPGVLAVGATDQSDQRAIFTAPGRPPGGSNYGQELGVMAPGSNILSTYYPNPYELDSGTSMAAPFVSGLAALMFSIKPNLSASEVIKIIEGTAEKVGSYPYDGTGPNSAITGNWNQYYGYGRINAVAALTAAANFASPSPNASVSQSSSPSAPASSLPFTSSFPSASSSTPPFSAASQKPGPKPIKTYSCTETGSPQAGKQIQLNNLDCTLTSRPNPSSPINFSAAGLDWDDAWHFILNQCTISTPCLAEIDQAAINEIGLTLQEMIQLDNYIDALNQGLRVTPPFNPDDWPRTNSRVWHCLGNNACRTQGFDYYDGTERLPVFTPTESCLSEFNACANSRPNLQSLIQEYPELIDLNCDVSDAVCSTDPVLRAKWR